MTRFRADSFVMRNTHDNNITFCTADHLISLMKDIRIDSEIMHDLLLAQKKCSHIVKNVIIKREGENY